MCVADRHRLPPAPSGLPRGRTRRPALHHRLRQDQARSPLLGRPREPTGDHGSVGHVRRTVDLRSGPRTATATTVTEVRAVSMDRDALKAWIDQRPEIAASNSCASSPDVCAEPTTTSQISLSPTSRGEGAAAARATLRSRSSGLAARHARPVPSRDRPADRRVARDRQQGTRRLHPSRLAPRRRQNRADLRP